MQCLPKVVLLHAILPASLKQVGCEGEQLARVISSQRKHTKRGLVLAADSVLCYAGHLDGLHHVCHNVWVCLELLLQCIQVVVGDELKARHVWACKSSSSSTQQLG